MTSASTVADLVRRHRPWLAEVEAQPVGCHQRALLRHVLAEMAAQGRVQQVGRGVGAADAVAAGGVDARARPHRPRRSGPPSSRPTWTNRSPSRFCVSVTVTTASPRADGAGVADLAARFAVERRLVGDDHHRAGLGAVDRLAVDDQRRDHALGMRRGVAQELGGAHAPRAGRTRSARPPRRPSPSRRRGRPRAGAPWRCRSRRCRRCGPGRAARPGSGRAGSRKCRRA